MRFFYTIVFLLLSTMMGRADSLTGSTVSGSIVPAYGYTQVIQQFASPQIIGPGTEFTGVVMMGIPETSFTITADFSNNMLTVNVQVFPNEFNDIASSDPLYSLLFSNPSFTAPFVLTSYTTTCPSCFTTSPMASSVLTGSTLDLSFDIINSGQTFVFQDTAAAAATPEPSGLALIGTGALMGIGAFRRKFMA